MTSYTSRIGHHKLVESVTNEEQERHEDVSVMERSIRICNGSAFFQSYLVEHVTY